LKELFTLFIIYLFFIVSSIVIGVGVYLIDDTYAYETAGTLLILSTITTLITFQKEFGDTK
ncbi:MAG: hypothetical protein ABXS91_09955, partial [Sulfurimonas sp.]